MWNVELLSKHTNEAGETERQTNRPMMGDQKMHSSSGSKIGYYSNLMSSRMDQIPDNESIAFNNDETFSEMQTIRHGPTMRNSKTIKTSSLDGEAVKRKKKDIKKIETIRQ